MDHLAWHEASKEDDYEVKPLCKNITTKLAEELGESDGNRLFNNPGAESDFRNGKGKDKRSRKGKGDRVGYFGANGRHGDRYLIKPSALSLPDGCKKLLDLRARAKFNKSGDTFHWARKKTSYSGFAARQLWKRMRVYGFLRLGSRH